MIAPRPVHPEGPEERRKREGSRIQSPGRTESMIPYWEIRELCAPKTIRTEQQAALTMFRCRLSRREFFR